MSRASLAATVTSSGAALADEQLIGRLGDRGSRVKLHVRVFPEGLILDRSGAPTATLLRTEVLRLTVKLEINDVECLDIYHTSPDLDAPLVLYDFEDSPLFVALEAMTNLRFRRLPWDARTAQ